MTVKITSPLSKEEASKLRAGDSCLISGVIYTARDAAHKRLCALLEKGEPLPCDVKDAVIYFAGPAPAKPGAVIGSVGPTTSYRMDAYSPAMIAAGQTGMIGKGKRRQNVKDSMIKNGAVYFAAVGGAGAILSKCIRESEVIAYPDLGTEAIRRLRVEKLPVIVIMDSRGNNLYETAVHSYLEKYAVRED